MTKKLAPYAHKPSPPPKSTESAATPDFIELGQILAETAQKAQPLFQQFISKYNFDPTDFNADPMNMRDTYAKFLGNLWSDPQKMAEMQMAFWQDWASLWQESAKKFLGADGKTLFAPDETDRRFKNDAWREHPFFDFIKQSYILTSRWMENAVHNTDGLSPEEKQKIDFQTRQFIDAMAPTNFILTNPDVVQETLNSKGENLIRGLNNMLQDLERGHGALQISTTDYKAFELGRNIAMTPGKVVYQNDLIQLIQYAPITETVFARPLLVVPPWINKYYILDLRPDNSFIRSLVERGHTVFAVSWVNPDKQLAQKRFEDYMEDGILSALTQMESITGEKQSNVIGYCLGGTLLAVTLGWLHAKGQADRVASATFLTTLLDFEHAGDLKLFMDDGQLAMMDHEMAEKGYLSADALKRTFSLLRANDLIWSFVINNYLLGREPFPFDLLYWNDDATNMPAAMHSFYLRRLYRDNLLKKPGGVTMKNVPIDVGAIETPSYFLSTREDHIAPWRATYDGARLLKGPVHFTLAASGHVAGIVNPPEKKKYCYWTSEQALGPAAESWLEKTTCREGSWWPHHGDWLERHGGKKLPARNIVNSLEDAPGSYVRMRSA